MLSVSNYFEYASNGHQVFDDIIVLETIFELPYSMASYSQSDSNLTNAFSFNGQNFKF